MAEIPMCLAVVLVDVAEAEAEAEPEAVPYLLPHLVPTREAAVALEAIQTLLVGGGLRRDPGRVRIHDHVTLEEVVGQILTGETNNGEASDARGPSHLEEPQ